LVNGWTGACGGSFGATTILAVCCPACPSCGGTTNYGSGYGYGSTDVPPPPPPPGL
jgi:hypothetical protein